MRSLLPQAMREVKPLDCRTNSISYGERGQVERGIIKEVYETLNYTFSVAGDIHDGIARFCCGKYFLGWPVSMGTGRSEPVEDIHSAQDGTGFAQC